jgi:hypothetical protein
MTLHSVWRRRVDRCDVTPRYGSLLVATGQGLDNIGAMLGVNFSRDALTTRHNWNNDGHYRRLLMEEVETQICACAAIWIQRAASPKGKWLLELHAHVSRLATILGIERYSLESEGHLIERLSTTVTEWFREHVGPVGQ